MLVSDNQFDTNYLSVSRDVKEIKPDQVNLRLSLLEKLRVQFVEILNFNPNPTSGPLALERKTSRYFPPNQSLNNLSIYNQNPETMNSSELLQLVHRINSEQTILNLDLFHDPEFVIVIQIHNRLEYLTILINSLLNVKDIHKTLLVFSHDMYYPEFNTLIRSIRFAPVVQIFFPFNQQIFKSEFPGHSKKDCSIKIKKKNLLNKHCFNANWSDTYGNFRNYKYTQTKHHWSWKAHFVFDRLRCAQNFPNPIVFIEEDHFLAEDFIHVLRLMLQEKKKKYPKVSVICLGTYEKIFSYVPSNRVQVGSWVSSFHNMGMAFDRSVWKKIQKCVKEFCEFDDYNWDWSLQHIHKRCLPEELQVMLLKSSPRIFHIGECGIHHKNKVCNPYVVLYKIQRLLSQNRQYLYPDDIAYMGVITARSKEFHPNGGWSDLRDRNLCKVLSTNSQLLDNLTIVEPTNNHLSSLESLIL